MSRGARRWGGIGTFPPIPATMRGYRASWLGPDTLAGLTLFAIAVPEQMATAQLVGVPAAVGLYAFVAGSLTFALLGRHRQMSVGADSTIAPILAAGVGAIAVTGTPRYSELMPCLAVMAGALIVTVGLVRLGWISEFLSTPAVTGLLAGIAVQIMVHQLPAVLGVGGGGTTTVGEVRDVVNEIGHTNLWSVGIAVATLVTVVVAERIDRRIPGALICLAGSILFVTVFGLESHGVPVLGATQRGLPRLAVPSASWDDIRHLIGPAMTVAFVCVVQTSATVRASSEADETAREFNRDLLGVGAGSVVAGLSGSFAVDASPPRTEIVTMSGGRSQLTSVVAAVAVLCIALVATGALENLPQATLGAILIFIATRLFRWRDLASLLRFDRLEFTLAIVTLLVVALVGVEQGVIVAMLISLAVRTQRTARPHDAMLGRELGTDHWIPTDIGRMTEQVPGVVVYQTFAPLWYGDAAYVKQRVRALLAAAAEPVHALVLDLSGMSDIDFTGAQMLGDLATEFKERGVTLAIARSSHLIHHDLKHSGLLVDIGPDQLFASVEEAIDSLQKKP
jgi:sulfate permease, SulP family